MVEKEVSEAARALGKLGGAALRDKRGKEHFQKAAAASNRKQGKTGEVRYRRGQSSNWKPPVDKSGESDESSVEN